MHPRTPPHISAHLQLMVSSGTVTVIGSSQVDPEQTIMSCGTEPPQHSGPVAKLTSRLTRAAADMVQ
jgi:hypothetical protein